MPIFDPVELQDIIRSGLGLPLDAMMIHFHETLLERYPGHIDPEPKWVLNQAAGSLGAFLALHASLEEYILIFGTPVGTQGHSGRFPADDYFFMMSGEQYVFAKGELEMRVFRPGDVNHMRRGTATAFRLSENGWGVEYARGFIPGMLPFGLADTMFGNLDYREFMGLVRVYGKLTARELAQKWPVGERVRRWLGVDLEARSRLQLPSVGIIAGVAPGEAAHGAPARGGASSSAAANLHR